MRRSRRVRRRVSRATAALFLTGALTIVIALLAGLGHASAGTTGASAAQYEYAKPRYSAIDLGTLGGSWSYATGINARGDVVGQSVRAAGLMHAFLWSNDVMIDLGTLGGSSSGAQAVNDRGQVVGWSWIEGDATVHAFLWERGVLTDLGTLGGGTSYASDVNNRGEVVGQSQTSAGEWRAFVWRDGTMTALSDEGMGAAWGTNNRGQIIGRLDLSDGPHAALWDSGRVTDLGSGEAWAINAEGRVVGRRPTAPVGYWRACLWFRGDVTDLGTLGGHTSDAYAVSGRGDVAGGSYTPSGNFHATLWSGGEVIDLNPEWSSWSIAYGVNDRGQIAGTAGDRAVLWQLNP